MLTNFVISRLLGDRVCLLFLSREGGIESSVATVETGGSMVGNGRLAGKARASSLFAAIVTCCSSRALCRATILLSLQGLPLLTKNEGL